MVDTFANGWLTLITGERLTASTALSIEHNDVLFLGEVVRCTPSGSEEWVIDIKVEHTLTGLQSLVILRAHLEQHQAQSGKDTPIEAPYYVRF
jgi:hypothetical protein